MNAALGGAVAYGVFKSFRNLGRGGLSGGIPSYHGGGVFSLVGENW